jgi:hypothetical protein
MNKITKRELEKIKAIQTYPSVSILFPTHRQHPENKQDSIRIRNLVNEAKNRLLKEFSNRDIKDLLSNLDEIVNKIDYNYTLDGMAIYISNEHSFRYDLHFPVKERVQIDKSFAIRDIVFGINRSEMYYTIMISEKETKLFSCVRNNLDENKSEYFPFQNTLYLTDTSDTSNDRIHPNLERSKNYLREIDKRIKIINEDESNLLIAGSERTISMFKDISTQKNLIKAEVRGGYEKINEKDFADLVWEEMKKSNREKRELVLEELNTAVKTNKYATGIDEVWKCTIEGRGKTLLTEINYQYPATVDEKGLNLIQTNIDNGEEVIDDAIDLIIEKIIDKGGKVVFFDNDQLNNYNKIALILRY